MMKRLVVPFECKAVGDREIEGYGSTFGNIDLGGDVVLAGAFSRSLAKHTADGTRPKMLWNHRSSDLPIGVWDEFSEDSKGLYMKGRFADTQMGNDVRTLAKMEAIDSMSIGYTIVDAEFTKEGVFLLKEIELWEVSPVNFPMNPGAVIAAVKSMCGDDPRAIEKYLRGSGLSRRMAKDVVHDLSDPSVRLLDADQREADEDLLRELKAREDALLAGLLKSRMRTYA